MRLTATDATVQTTLKALRQNKSVDTDYYAVTQVIRKGFGSSRFRSRRRLPSERELEERRRVCIVTDGGALGRYGRAQRYLLPIARQSGHYSTWIIRPLSAKQ